jgi:hypothetical protein
MQRNTQEQKTPFEMIQRMTADSKDLADPSMNRQFADSQDFPKLTVSQWMSIAERAQGRALNTEAIKIRFATLLRNALPTAFQKRMKANQEALLRSTDQKAISAIQKKIANLDAALQDAKKIDATVNVICDQLNDPKKGSLNASGGALALAPTESKEELSIDDLELLINFDERIQQWNFKTNGKLDGNESAFMAMFREFLEETGYIETDTIANDFISALPTALIDCTNKFTYSLEALAEKMANEIVEKVEEKGMEGLKFPFLYMSFTGTIALKNPLVDSEFKRAHGALSDRRNIVVSDMKNQSLYKALSSVMYPDQKTNQTAAPTDGLVEALRTYVNTATNIVDTSKKSVERLSKALANFEGNHTQQELDQFFKDNKKLLEKAIIELTQTGGLRRVNARQFLNFLYNNGSMEGFTLANINKHHVKDASSIVKRSGSVDAFLQIVLHSISMQREATLMQDVDSRRIMTPA